jgi:valyl-tRNA synthetase
MAALAIPGMDLSLSEERMLGYRAFVNKIWNASRFVLMNLDEEPAAVVESDLTMADRWIRSRLSGITADLEAALDQYKFYEAADKIYHFVWHEFCDWYIEMAKASLHAGNRTTRAVLAGALDHILKLLNPFIPFVTEEIWSHLPGHRPSLVTAAFPKSEAADINPHVEVEMSLLRDLVVEVRTIRAENKISPQKKIAILLKAPGEKEKDFIPEIRAYIQALANGSEVTVVDRFAPEARLLKGVAGSWEVAIPLEEAGGLEAERARLEKEIKKVEAEIERLEGRLQKKEFLERAPGPIIEEAKESLLGCRDRKAKLQKSLDNIKA